MRNFLHGARVGLIVCAALAASAATASAAPYSGLYVFGDSLSDTGNLYAEFNKTIPVAPYANGRFSNGDLWIQDVSASLGLGTVTPSLKGGNDFAFGGAETGTTLAHTANPLDLPAQLASYNLLHLGAQPNALYTLWIGSNDVDSLLTALASGTLTTTQIGTDISEAVGNVATTVNGLAKDGMKNLLALDVPDLGKTPGAIGAGTTAVSAATTLSAAFDTALATTLTGLSQQDSFNLHLVDTFSALDTIVADKNAFGFDNVTGPCWTGSYTDPNSGTLCSTTQAGQDKYLFWDSLHPTAAGHQRIADAALAQLTPVPEPGSAGILAIAIAGLFVLRRKTADRSLL